MQRRDFLKECGLFLLVTKAVEGLFGAGAAAAEEPAGTKAGGGSGGESGNGGDHLYGMAIDVDKCIGCGRCVEACKTENGVPKEPFFCRTWVERYTVKTDNTLVVQSITSAGQKSDAPVEEKEIKRSFFVPKLCNHCAHPPCVQVCPVGATFSTKEGVVIVDEERCIGCRYCIQACPYGARYLNPETHTADKCTFCYHRVTKGMLPACVEVCPTQARIFGDLKGKASPLQRFERMRKIHTLKPGLNTEPKVFYADLDGVVR
ncbi:MAG: 4Fe-4S dicluster domain-containing protein [Planctomycetes bacterium]|nr:4Fe-4S dicluster domain-containing protein [Planctomycetota bacterium]